MEVRQSVAAVVLPPLTRIVVEVALWTTCRRRPPNLLVGCLLVDHIRTMPAESKRQNPIL